MVPCQSTLKNKQKENERQEREQLVDGLSKEDIIQF